MKVESLYVRHFRNLSDQTISFRNGLNEVVGDNAQGKTALLEALHVLILGGSFRTYQMRDIIQHERAGFFVEATVDMHGVRKTVSLSYDGARRAVMIDGQSQISSSQLLGTLLGVTATLEDQDLVFGPPAARRRFLDEQIAQIDPFYVTQLSRYARALSQRNRLLKMRDFRSIEAWEEQLARAGAYIVGQRRRTTDLLAPKVVTAYRSLFGEIDHPLPLTMSYITQEPVGKSIEWYQQQYRDRRDQEARAAVTLVGPHRDDIEWAIGNKPCRSVASLGQARSVALSLRCAEWNLLKERSGEVPLFLVDDVESALDPIRTSSFFEICQELGQVCMTSHTPQSTVSHVLAVRGGVVVRQGPLGVS